MSAVFDDSVGFDEPAADENTDVATTGDKNAITINSEIQRMQSAIAELDRVAASLPDIEARFPKDVVYEITTVKGMKAALEHRAAWRDPRITVEKARKMAKAPILTLGKRIDARASNLTELLLLGEAPIDALIKTEEARKEEERQRKVNEELGRVMKIQEALAEIGEDVRIACGKTSANIKALLDTMAATQPDQLVFQEMIGSAKEAWTAAIAKLDTAYKAKLWDEEQEAERQRAEAERKRRQEAEDAERARISAEQTAEALRLKGLAEEQARREREFADQGVIQSMNEMVMDCIGKSAAEIRAVKDTLAATVFAETAGDNVRASHKLVTNRVNALLAQAVEQEQRAEAARLAEERERQQAEERAGIAAQAALDTPQGDQPGSEPGREVMESDACESAAGRGDTVAPALATLPQHESPDVGPMGAGQPADAGPSGEIRDTDEVLVGGAAPPIVCDSGFGPVPADVYQPAHGTTEPAPIMALLDHLRPVFESNFPSNPKGLTSGWWVELRFLANQANLALPSQLQGDPL